MAYQKSTREILQDIYDQYDLGAVNEEVSPGGEQAWTRADGMQQLRLFTRSFVDGMKRADDYALAKYEPNEVQFIKSKYSEIFRTLANLFEEDSTQPFGPKLAEEISNAIVDDYMKEIHGVDSKNTES